MAWCKKILGWLLTFMVGFMIFAVENPKDEACENLATWLHLAMSEAICQTVPEFVWSLPLWAKVGIALLPVVVLVFIPWFLDRHKGRWATLEDASRDFYDKINFSNSNTTKMIVHGEDATHIISALLFVHAKDGDLPLKAAPVHGKQHVLLRVDQLSEMVPTRDFKLAGETNPQKPIYDQVLVDKRHVDLLARKVIKSQF